jgi:protein translocase SecG subunit
MFTILKYFQAIVAIMLTVAILIQNRSSGLSSTFGGTGTISTTKRGPEKLIFRATIVLAVLFVLSAIAFMFVR